MNQYLTALLNAAAIDLEHLTNKYLSPKELEYIDRVLVSKKDFEECFYTDEHGKQLEVLLLFLNAHKDKIINLMEGKGGVDALKELYTSSIISGAYDCFRFDLSKFPQSYMPTNQILTLYRIGREGEYEGNLGCSWAREIEGLKAYCFSSVMSKAILESRPVFSIKIDDSQILFEGNRMEFEFVLMPNFVPDELHNLDAEWKNKIGI